MIDDWWIRWLLPHPDRLDTMEEFALPASTVSSLDFPKLPANVDQLHFNAYHPANVCGLADGPVVGPSHWF